MAKNSNHISASFFEIFISGILLKPVWANTHIHQYNMKSGTEQHGSVPDGYDALAGLSMEAIAFLNWARKSRTVNVTASASATGSAM